MNVLGLIVLALPVSVLGGFVTSELWRWFLVPLGAAPISLWHACGISVLVGVFTTGLTNRFDAAQPGGVAAGVAVLAHYVVAYLTAWAVGAVYHALMGRGA